MARTCFVAKRNVNNVGFRVLDPVESLLNPGWRAGLSLYPRRDLALIMATRAQGKQSLKLCHVEINDADLFKVWVPG